MSRSCLSVTVAAGLLLAHPLAAVAGDTDRFGVPLPAGVVARLEGLRLREPYGWQRTSAGRVWGVALSPDGKLLLTAVSGAAVRYWDPATGEELPRPALPIAAETRLLFSPDGKQVVALGHREAPSVHDPVTGKLLFKLEQRGQEPPWPQTYTPDGKALAGSGRDGVVFWDAATGTIVREQHRKDGSRAVLAFAPNGKTLALGCDDGTVRFRDPAAAVETGRLEAHAHSLGALAWAPDGKTLATHGYDYKLRLWDVTLDAKGVARTAKRRAEVPQVYLQANMAFTPDGKYLVIGQNGGVGLRDPETGRLLSRTHQDGTSAHSIAISPDGKTVFWAEQSPSVRMARLDGGRAGAAAARAPRRGGLPGLLSRRQAPRLRQPRPHRFDLGPQPALSEPPPTAQEGPTR
jgi:WD40 repeat protein